MALRVSFQQQLDQVEASLQEESDLVVRSLRGAINALEQRDLELADEVIAFDDEVDREYQSIVDLDELIDRGNRRVVERILQLGDDLSIREWGLRMIIVSRCLERIGDHAVDIGEQAAYLVTGEFREFTDASHPGEAPRP